MEKSARLRAGKRVLPRGAVSDLVRHAIESMLTVGAAQHGADCAPAHTEGKHANTSIDNSITNEHGSVSDGGARAA